MNKRGPMTTKISEQIDRAVERFQPLEHYLGFIERDFPPKRLIKAKLAAGNFQTIGLIRLLEAAQKSKSKYKRG